jgi:integrase
MEHHILPKLGAIPLGRLSPMIVRDWFHGLAAVTGPTMRAHAYALLRTILASAVSDDALVANPCRIRGAGNVKRAKHIVPATLPELTAITEAMPERLRPMVLLASWCAMRQGELFELRRSDVDLAVGVIRVRRGVVRADGQVYVGGPKTNAGSRNIPIPPHLTPVLLAHLNEHVGERPDALLFPARHGGHMAPSTLYKTFYPAREAAGRPDLRFHDLRHTGAVLAAATGATLADLMDRLGHSTAGAAMRYQHAAEDRGQAIAAALSEFATGNVVPLRKRGRSA